MKILFQILSISLFAVSVNAQSTIPEPPTPPSSKSSSSSSSSSKSSISGSSSTSVSKSDKSLRFNAKFNKARYDKVKAFLISKLGRESLNINGNTYKWSKEEDAFKCTLTSRSLNFNLNYNEASKSLEDEVDSMLYDLKYALSNSSPENDLKRAQKQIERAKRDIELAKKDLERAQEDLKKAKKEAERLNKSIN